MKKIIFIASAFIFICMMTTTGIFADSQNSVTDQISQEKISTAENAFTDIDENSVTADNSQNTNNACYQQNYVDSNNDGICDHYDEKQCQNNTGNCQQTNCNNYCDQDHDGVCDRYQDRDCAQDGTGQHNHHHGGR